jgi:uncharacterized protein YbaP (TraB family)
MRWWRILGLSLFISGVAASAATALDRARSQAQTSLWSVQAEAGKVYLLGSVHFLRPSDYPLPDAMEQAYANSAKLVLETDIGAMASPEIQQKMIQLGFYPENETIFDHLGPGTAELLRGKLTDLGLPASLVSRLKPWTAAMTLEVLILKLMGFDEQSGVDFYFYRRARADGKDLEFLETVDYQLTLLAGLDERNQDALLRQTLEELDRVEQIAPKMVSYWRSGDFEGLSMLSPMPSHLHDRLLTRRNHNWMIRIQSYLAHPENTLVVVGALHLAGPDSVVDLLRQRGLTVVQH